MDHRPPRPDQPYAWDDERLSAYLDGELSAPEQAQLEARLVVDPELRQLVDELRAVRQQLEILPEYRLKPTFADQVLRRAEQEMLLSPVGRETTEPSVAPAAPLAAATPVSASPAVVQPVVTTLPTRLPSRLWRRGAMWTAIAAAAVLLLIVTNRPHTPQQEHIARNDVPVPLPAKPSAAKAPADPQATPAGLDKTLQNQNAIAAMDSEQERLAKAGERESQQIPFGQAEPSVSNAVGDANGKKSAANPQAASFGAAAAMPKPDAGVDMKRDANQLARAAADKKSNANQLRQEASEAESAKNQNAGASGKPLMKSQSPSQRKGIQEKQTAAPNQQLSPELTALLASDEFSSLASAGEGRADSPDEDQVLVVYMSPRDELRGESSFESMLEKNSIGLSEKSLIPTGEKLRERMFALAKPGDRDEKPLAKAAAKDQNEAGAKDHKAVETRDEGKAKNPSNGAMPRMEAPPAPEIAAVAEANQPALTSKLYYLEADVSQVDELLRQLRSSATPYTRLNITPRALKLAESGPRALDEKSNASKPAAAQPQAAGAFGDDSRAEGISLAGKQQDGNQQPVDSQQLAQGSAPAPPAIPAPIGTPLPPAPAPSAPTAEPFAPPTPVAPKEIAATATPAARPLDAPAATDGATSLGGGQGGFGQGNHDGLANRHGNQADKNSQIGANDRAIAYRLRGVEMLMPAMKAESAGQASEGGRSYSGGDSGSGVAKMGKAEFDMQRAGVEAKHGNSANAPELTKPSDARNQSKSEGEVQKLETTTADAKNSDAVPASQPVENAPKKSGSSSIIQEKKMEQARPQADSTGAPASAPMPSESLQRQLDRAKATANSEESLPAENSTLAGATASAVIRQNDSTQKEFAKNAAPITATKRVRVLFVIEHEAPKK